MVPGGIHWANHFIVKLADGSHLRVHKKVIYNIVMKLLLLVNQTIQAWWDHGPKPSTGTDSNSHHPSQMIISSTPITKKPSICQVVSYVICNISFHHTEFWLGEPGPGHTGGSGTFLGGKNHQGNAFIHCLTSLTFSQPTFYAADCCLSVGQCPSRFHGMILSLGCPSRFIQDILMTFWIHGLHRLPR